MEELTENAEEPDEGESKHSEQKLGKLQYKVSIVLVLMLGVVASVLVVVLLLSTADFSLPLASTPTLSR